MESRSNCLFITYVEKEGPFLKVWGQTEKNTSLYIEQVLHSFTNQFDNGLCIPHPETLQIGILCCAKYKDNKYYRARITSLDFLHNRYIEVNFIDYGHKDVVPISNIRSLEGFESSFISIQPQAASFLLAEAVCPRGEWNEACLDEISKEIRYSEVNFSIIAQVTKHYLVRLFVGVNDLAILLISRGLMRHTSLTTQEAVLLSMMPRSAPQQPVMQQNIATYKAFTLEPGSQYEVYVSYVTDGPCNFSVQLKQSEEVLGKLMKEINSMNLTPIEGIPLPGTVCLARCMEDGHICRAVVTNEVDGHYKVFYVDFGNFEVVPLEALYEIPFKYVIPKVMAIRFALSGVEKSTVTLEMQCAFKQFVDNRLIHMKVMPMTARSSLPRCELWDPETQVSALDIVNQAAAAAYPDHISLNRGFSQPVKISYVFSCNRFYVQLTSKQDELLRLMLDIQSICRDSEPLGRDSIKVGQPCYALFEADQQWYRSQIVEVLPGGKVKVQYVDYGNEEVLSTAALRPIEGKQLTVLRPQAIECCLNGYQNMEPDTERDNLLEELILEQEFTMKVVEMQGKKALIELIDSSNYNVASLLLDKIAVTRSQVSPMLVQAGNKIEHRKSSIPHPKDHPFRQDQRKLDRTNEINDNNAWKSNKGFNKNFDRNKRDPDLSDSNESDRQSNKSYNKNNDRNRNEFNSRNNDGGSWRQDNKAFNRNQDKPYKDNNKNDWGNGEEKRNSRPRDKEEWTSENSFERKGYHSRDKDEWVGNRENDKKNFNSKGKSDSWGNNKNDNCGNEENKDWGNKDDKRGFGHKDNFRKKQDRFSEKDDWGDTGGNTNTDGWDSRDGKKDFAPRDNFKRNKDRFNHENNDWGSESAQKSGGFRKKPAFKRETSELSSSGSEKSFRKGFRDNKNKQGFNKKFDRSPKNDSFGNDSGGDAWNVSASTTVEVPNAAPATAKFEILNVNQSESTVIISWFHNPGHFYCQIEDAQVQFKKMMEDIQYAYKSRQPGTAVIGAPVIGLFPEDNVLYRAQVLETIGSQFKVYYVDFGNVSVINKVWPIEMRFMELPAQAVCCKLDGIEPPADSWPDASTFSQYFDKKQFTCKFLSTDNDRVSVKLEYNGEDIGSLLLKDGLAKSSVVCPSVDIALLIGQQFRAMLLSVNSLGDFIMSLQSGFLLNCSVFNLAQSTETWEDNLKQKLEQILIVYVDDLKEDKLEVTLYDQNGAKIKLIDKDETAYENVELFCPYLITQSVLSGVVTHVDDNTVYIQPSDCEETVEYLLNTMFEFYESSTVENPITPVEGYVYAVRGSDTNWYRGRITSVDESKVDVFYIDYGNPETVEVDALRELAVEYTETPLACVPVTVKVPTENLLGLSVVIDLEFTEAGLEGTIREEQAVETVVEPVAEPVMEPTESAEVAEAPAQANEAVGEEVPNKVCGTQVILSHTDSPSDFYLQLAESVQAIDELQASLQEQIAEMADMDNPVIGVLCAAPYSLDQQWYRAHILDADADITTVRFVDYGNTDVLDNQTTRVKTLPPSLLSLEVHATRCRLKIKPTDEEWASAASERFEELCNVDTLTAQFVHQDEKTNYVELYSNGVNVREVLIQEKLALPDEELPETKVLGFVSHLNSPSEFWIQLENCVDELEWVAEQLSGAENFPELEDLAPGTLCAALFPDDQMWYRARILSNTVAGIEVLFVDYGNSCTSCSLRELPEDLVMLPPLAQKCSLQKPDNLTNWGPEMVRKFVEIAADGQTTFNVKKLSTGETASVQLLLDEVDVTIMLLPPQTEDVRVKSFEGLDELVIVKYGEELESKFKLEPLPDVAWNEESSKKFAEINKDGETVFQAEFISDDMIRLYLGLNDIRLDLSGTKTTTPTSSPLKSRTENNGVNADIKNIIVDIVEASINPNKTFIESIVTDIVNESSNQADSHTSSSVNTSQDECVSTETTLNSSDNTSIDGNVDSPLTKDSGSIEAESTVVSECEKAEGDTNLISSPNKKSQEAETDAANVEVHCVCDKQTTDTSSPVKEGVEEKSDNKSVEVNTIASEKIHPQTDKVNVLDAEESKSTETSSTEVFQTSDVSQVVQDETSIPNKESDNVTSKISSIEADNSTPKQVRDDILDITSEKKNVPTDDSVNGTSHSKCDSQNLTEHCEN